MTNKSKIFDLISWIGLILGFSLADWEHIVYIIIGLISLATTIISGIISIVIKVKHSLKDGKITDDDAQFILDYFKYMSWDFLKDYGIE